MRAELIAAAAAFILAGLQLLTVELRIRAARRERDELRQGVDDAKRAAHADRRHQDHEREPRRSDI